MEYVSLIKAGIAILGIFSALIFVELLAIITVLYGILDEVKK